MNCQLFETVINDIARAAVMDARTRDAALAHSEDCERCAARLQDERMLTAGLSLVAASAGMKEAPARIESALLAAFREQHSSRLAPVANQSQARRWTRRAFALAASILILIALAWLRFDHSSYGPVENAREVKPEQTAPGSLPREAETPAEVASNTREQPVADVTKQQPAQTLRRYARRNKARAVQKPQVSGPELAEITTEFIPLVNQANLNSMESGQIVRVELPRSALISFGLPMNMERADERIKADVVLGNDGLARAIRFIR